MATSKNTPAPTSPKPPAGFDDCNRPDIHGWFKAEAGLCIYGKILSHMVLPDAKGMQQDCLVIELYEPLKAQKDKKAIELKKGENVGLRISAGLKPALEYAENNGEIWALCEEKIDLGKGQTMWRYDLRCKGDKAELEGAANPTKKAKDDEVEDEGDTPTT